MGLLRLLLALVVVTGHSSAICGWRLTGSFVAVQTFFIISGFYMSLVLNGKYRGPGSYRLFMGNRVLRLFPAYWVVLLVAVLGSWASYVLFGTKNIFHDYVVNPHGLGDSTFLFLVLSNLAVVGQDTVMFLGVTAQGFMELARDFRSSDPQLWTYLFVPQTWSISLELMFYLVAPFLLRKRLSLLLGLIAGSAVLRVWLHKGIGLNFDPWTYRFFPTELGLFLLGAVAYHLYLRVRERDFSEELYWAVALVFAFVLIMYQFIPGGMAKKAAFYALTVFSLPFLFGLTKDWHWDRRIGELSYPVYISHFLFLPSFDGRYWLWPESEFLESLQAAPYYGLVVVLCSLAFSWVLLRGVIDPIDRLRAARVRRLELSK